MQFIPSMSSNDKGKKAESQPKKTKAKAQDDGSSGNKKTVNVLDEAAM